MMTPFTILFDDAHVVAVAKPAGLLSVPAPGPHTKGMKGKKGSERNLADLVRRDAHKRGQKTFPVHRLDRDTSGVMVFAKSEPARQTLEDAFRDRRVQKTYLALVHGAPRKAKGSIKTFIVDRGKTAASKRKPVAGGREAVTTYRVVSRFARAALVEANPVTGRFNQIRLHLADLGCPIIGERKYAIASQFKLKFKRPLLHAARLSFPHPATGNMITVEAPPPDDFQAFVRALKGDRG